MNWTLDKSRPISRQICEKLCVAVTAGEIKAGDKLASVRELAVLAGVNPNTVQKSFEELERLGVVHSVPYSGWYVNDDIAAAMDEVKSLKRKTCEEYITAMAQLGCGKEEIIAQLNTVLDEMKGENE